MRRATTSAISASPPSTSRRRPILQKAIEDLKKQVGPTRSTAYVIDLRNNPGGLLDQAISVSDAFLDQGEIVSTRGRNLEETERSNARPGDLTDGAKPWWC